jgi:hypothetical protein
VTLVSGVPVPVVHIVHVVTMRYGHVSAAGAVLVIMRVERGVARALAFVDVVAVRAVQVSIVRVVHVIAVRHGDMTTRLSVGVRMVRMRLVRR